MSFNQSHRVIGHEAAHHDKAPPCKKRPPGPIIASIYHGTYRGWLRAPSLIGSDFYAHLDKHILCLPIKESEDDAIRVVGVVVIVVAIVVHVHEVRGVARISGTEPPVGGTTMFTARNHIECFREDS